MFEWRPSQDMGWQFGAGRVEVNFWECKMRSDQGIYADIAKVLLSYGPVGSRVLKYGFWVIAENGSTEGGAYSYEFDFVDDVGEEKWFMVEDVAASMKLCDLCFELRNFMHEKTGNLWRENRFVLDVGGMRFSADFKHD